MIQNSEFLNDFVEEARGHLEVVEGQLMSLTKGTNENSINSLFRAVHSIKGTAGFFALKKLVNVAHAMENVFGLARSGEFAITSDHVDVLLKSFDILKVMVDDIMESENINIEGVIKSLEELLNSKKSNNESLFKEVVLREKDGSKEVAIGGVNTVVVDSGIRRGHNIYAIKLGLNRDLLNYSGGPIALVKNIEGIGQIVDCITDTSEIVSLDSLINCEGECELDIYLMMVITTVLEIDIFAAAISIPANNIKKMETYDGQKEVLFDDIKTVKEQKQVQVEQKTQAQAAIIDMQINKTLKDEQNKEVALIEIDDTKKVENIEKAENIEKTENIENIEKTENIEDQKIEEQKLSNAPKPVTANETLRVNVNLLNDLLNMASEMVLARNQLLRALDVHRKDIQGLAPILQNVDRLTSGMQEKIMQTRMQPVSNVFGKFPRMIRDISKKLSKEIELVIEGGEVELDKSMIEGLVDPLTHLVRNSADHGIEEPHVRGKSGKTKTGLIQLRAYQEGGHVNIDVIDDGAGIDVERVKKKGVENKIVSLDDLKKMSEQEVLNMIFLPGFSTAKEITEVSGRGVGMDVVRTNMEKLGGTIEIFTTKGKGTTIRTILPLTLAIVQSLIVEVEGQRFALPQANIMEIVKIKQGDKTRKIEFIHDSEVLRLRGRLLPLIHLTDALKLEKTYIRTETNEKMLDKRNSNYDERKISHENQDPVDLEERRDISQMNLRILVLKIGSRKYGVIVDKILGSEETLVKPLPSFLKDCICYSGVTIMGDGKASMILDPDGLTKVTELKFRDEENEDKNALEKGMGAVTGEIQSLLLFSCSGDETHAIDMAMVSRIEEIKASDIQRIGDQEFIEYRGSSMRIIRPENYLSLSKKQKELDRYYVIVPKLVKHPIGIVAETILDNVTGYFKLSTDDVFQKGIVGTILINGRMVVILNAYELFEKADPENYSSKNIRASKEYEVLIVEDTPFFQRMEKSYFEQAGFTVHMAGNGKEGLNLLLRQTVDVIISDINMPIMDGYEFVKTVKEMPQLKDIPVIAVTSMTGDVNKAEGLSKGFDYYESKLDRDTLLGVATKAIEERRGKVG